MNIKLTIRSLSLFLLCVAGAVYPMPAVALREGAEEAALREFLRSLPESQRIAQLFLVNIDGWRRYEALEYDEEGRPMVPGGCLFFSYNVAPTAPQLMDFTDSIAEYCIRHDVLRPYLAIDQEGGEVNRLRAVTSAVPSNRQVAAAYTPEQAARLYGAQAAQLRALGFDLNLAPVAEPAVAGNEGFLGSRSYGAVAESAVYSLLAVRAYEGHRVGAAVKHFPGNTNTDPHTGLPEIAFSPAELQTYVIRPFSIVLAAHPTAVLLSHARTAACDPRTPACLSTVWVRDVLRNGLGFEGLVISDDIFMAALAENGFPPEQAAVRAVLAGVDVIMLSEKKFAAVARELEREASRNADFAARLQESELRVLRYKLACGILRREELPDGGVTVRQQEPRERYGGRDGRLADFAAAKEAGEALLRGDGR